MGNQRLQARRELVERGILRFVSQHGARLLLGPETDYVAVGILDGMTAMPTSNLAGTSSRTR